MLILYNKAARKNLSKPKEAAKWYPVLRSTGMLKEREVPKLIAGIGSFRRGNDYRCCT